eukprot:9468305-Pyramimonas_sp.AAC.1
MNSAASANCTTVPSNSASSACSARCAARAEEVVLVPVQHLADPPPRGVEGTRPNGQHQRSTVAQNRLSA